MRVDVLELGALGRPFDDHPHSPVTHLFHTFGDKEPGQIVVPSFQVPPNQSEFVAGDRVVGRPPPFQSLNPDLRAVELEPISPNKQGLTFP